jgi:DNA-binding protein H-NS
MANSLSPLAKSIMKARSAAKDLEIKELEKLIANLSAILKSEKEKQKSKEETARKAKIAKIKALMQESGLKPADIQGAGGGRKRKAKSKAKAKGRKVAPKYRLVVDGQEHLWSGRGRPPRVFKDYLDAGNSKESCAIK